MQIVLFVVMRFLHPEAFWTRSRTATVRADRYLAAVAAFILRVAVTEATLHHTVCTLSVRAADGTGRLFTVTARVLGAGVVVAKRAGYRTIRTCSAHLVLVTAWSAADVTLPPSLVLAVLAVTFLKH